MFFAAVAWAGLTLGNWQVAFDEDGSKLTLSNPSAEARVVGTLSFTARQKSWRVVAPRDAVQSRLALLDDKGDVQGYLAFNGAGDRLEILAYHRTAQNYSGELRFDGETSFTRDSFACRTRPSRESRVLQLASGPSDSALNDSLFDPQKDRALLFRAAGAQLSSRGPGTFGLSLRARIDEAEDAAWTLSLERDYYRSRYVPYFKPIDRKRCPSPPTGWMSWNTYFDQATAEDNLAEARAGQEHLQPFGMEFWSIESWQDNSDRLPVSKFDNLSLTPSPQKFPLGMKRLADDIRALGFRPGLWTAPFGTGSTNFYLAHKSWFLHDKEGKPIPTWNGKFTIDPSNPDVIRHLREIHRVASQEWGYEYFKIDGMSGRSSGYCAHFYERPEIKAAFMDPSCPNPFERCVNAFREGIGPDRVFLACQGHFTGAEVAVADASRTGADIVHPDQPPKWENLMSQARCTLNQVFAHNIVFFADPDTLLVGDFLGLEQARLATTVVALPGQMMFSGDRLRDLKPDRMRLLQQALPVCDVRPLDLFPVFRMLPVWDLKVRRPFAEWDVVALFNWSDQPASVGFEFSELGLSAEAEYVLYEFWTGSLQGTRKGRFEMSVPERGVRLLAVHRAQPHPQFLSSDRHVTQGGVELQSLDWKAGVRKLSGSVRAVKGHPLTLRFFAPAGFSGKPAASASPNVTCACSDGADGVLSLTLTAPETRDVAFELAWP